MSVLRALNHLQVPLWRSMVLVGTYHCQWQGPSHALVLTELFRAYSIDKSSVDKHTRYAH